MFGYVMDDDYWCDVGNLQQYREAQYTVLDGKTRVLVGNGSSQGQHNGVWVGEGCDIDPTAHMNAPVVIGRNCKIKADAVVGPYSVIGDNCIIEEKAQVHRSVLWDNVYVGVESQLSACTVCSYSTIKSNCVIQEGAVIGARCRIEDDSTIRTQIKLWPDKIIEAGSTVTMSLIWGQKWAGSLFRKNGVMGIANIEMTPDFACKLGASFGGYLKKGATVVTSRDSGPVARMMKRAMISGLLSVGVNVLDMRSMPLPVSRHGIIGTQATGGVHIRLSPDDPKLLLIEFFDDQGVYLSKNAERKVETIFFREDFRRVDAEQVGQLEFASRGIEQYAEDFYRHIKTEAVEKRHLKVVADFAFGRLANVYPTMLGTHGRGFDRPQRLPGRRQDAQNARSPRRPAAQPGADRADAARRHRRAVRGGRRAHDDHRRVRQGDRGRQPARHDGRSGGPHAGARPHRRSRDRAAHDRGAGRAARRHGAAHQNRCARPDGDVRAASRAQAGRVDFAGDDAGGFIFSEFQPSFDAMFAFGKLLELLATTDIRLSELSAELPHAHVARALVRCPWEVKGPRHARPDQRGRQHERQRRASMWNS